MTDYMLTAGVTARLDMQPIVIRLSPSNARAPRVELIGDVSEPQWYPDNQRLRIPVVNQRMVLRVMPPDGAVTFEGQSKLSVLISPERPGADTARLEDVDVSGLDQRDLLALAPVGNLITVTALGDNDPEPDLPPTAQQARYATRRLLRVSQLPPARSVDLLALIDMSASMRRFITDDVVAQTCELLAGIASVVSQEKRLRAAYAGLTTRWLPPAEPHSFAAAVREGFATLAASIGARPGLGNVVVDDQTLVYCITDSVPPESADLPTGRSHLVILGAAASSSHNSLLPRTVVPAAPGGWATWDYDDLVRSLLRETGLIEPQEMSR